MRTKWKVIIGVAILFVAVKTLVFVGEEVQNSNRTQEAKQVITEIQDQYSSLIKSSTDAQGLPKFVEKQIDTTPKAHGELGEYERWFKELINQVALQRNDYLLELKAIGWNSLMDANRIDADKTFVESKEIILNAKKIVNKYQEKNYTLINNTKERIESLHISDTLKENMRSGFERGIENARNSIDAIWSLEKKVINEFESIINLLSARKNDWIVESGQIVFYNDNDLYKFNSYVASIQNIANQQGEIQRQNVQNVNNSLDSIKDM